jgi:ribosomal protein S18 acetylase RimI-like enzyme
MVSFIEVPTTDARAVRLLSDYFANRELTFPSAQGTYVTKLPAAEHFVPPTGVFLLALDDESSPIGCGGIRRIEGRPRVDGPQSSDPATQAAISFEVKHLWVDPGSRGNGTGKAILDELERRAVAFGSDELVLDTNASLEAAARLYRRTGYLDIPPYNDNPNATNWYAKPLR